MYEWNIRPDPVHVPTSLAAAGQVAGRLKVDDEPVRGAFSYPDALGYVAQACPRVAGYAQQDVRVVSQKVERCHVATVVMLAVTVKSTGSSRMLPDSIDYRVRHA